MEYLGHTQSANYTFGPWRSQPVRSSPPVAFLPSVQRQMPGSTLPYALQRSQTSNDDNWIHKRPAAMTASYGHAPVFNGVQQAAQSADNCSRYKAAAKVGFDLSYGPSVTASDLPSWKLTRSSTTVTDNRPGSLPDSSTTGIPTVRRPGAIDWVPGTRGELMAADRIRSGSELIRADILTLCRDTCDRTRRTQTDTTHRIGDRINDVKFWRDEVRKEADMATKEATALQKATGSLERALGETIAPLQIAEECLQLRREKIGRELADDAVEKEIIKEIEGIRQCQQEMSDVLKDIKSLAASNDKSHSNLINDAADKQDALRLDKASHQLRQTSQGLQLINGIDTLSNGISDPDSWIRHTNQLVAKSQADRAASSDARNQVEQVLDKCATSITNQWNVVNETLNDRVCDYTDARNKLQTQLAKVLQETIELGKSGELLTKSIRDKEAPLMLAQTRLATRGSRPNIEFCKDLAQGRLVNEVQEIESTVDQLLNKMADIEQTMRTLGQTRSSLEYDLCVKNNSIHVDRDMCLSWRKSFDMSPRRTVSY